MKTKNIYIFSIALLLSISNLYATDTCDKYTNNNNIFDVREQYLTVDKYKAIMKETQTTLGVKGKPLYMAVRVGISKSTEGPELDSLSTLIPVRCIKKRIEKVLSIKK